MFCCSLRYPFLSVAERANGDDAYTFSLSAACAERLEIGTHGTLARFLYYLTDLDSVIGRFLCLRYTFQLGMAGCKAGNGSIWRRSKGELGLNVVCMIMRGRSEPVESFLDRTRSTSVTMETPYDPSSSGCHSAHRLAFLSWWRG